MTAQSQLTPGRSEHLLGGALFYLQNQKVETLEFSDITGQIKDTFFPEKAPNYVYYRDEGTDLKGSYIRYYFESPGPKLSLELDPSGKFFNIKSIQPINRILVYLGLPKVDRPVRELAALGVQTIAATAGGRVVDGVLVLVMVRVQP